VCCLAYFVVTYNHPPKEQKQEQGAFDWRKGPARRSESGSLLVKAKSFAAPETSMAGLDEYSELPMISPGLTMSSVPIRLAVPIEPLSEPDFVIDVLGLSGVALLSASLMSRGGRRTIQVALHSLNQLQAEVTSGLEVLGADGTIFGKLTQEYKSRQYVFCDPRGHAIMAIIPRAHPPAPGVHQSPYMQMVSQRDGQTIERATVTRCPAGRLPAPNYELIVKPQVDAVLVLVCFLGLEVFVTHGFETQ